MASQSPKTLSRKLQNNTDSNLNTKISQLISPKSIKNKPISQPLQTKLSKLNDLNNDICCSKQNQCQFQYRPKQSNLQEENSFSFDSQLLKDQIPILIDIQPEIQLQVKPQIDQLIQANIRMNRYKEAYKKIQKQQQQKIRIQQLKKVHYSAKQALNRIKTQIQPHKNKWGHSIYGQQQTNVFIKTDILLQTDKNKLKTQSPNTKKQSLQNAAEIAKKRIKQFKQRQQQKEQLLKKKQETQQQTKLDQKKLQEVNAKINQNALKILKQKQQEIEEVKKRKQQLKKKITQLQKESLNNCKKSRQNPIKILQGKQEDMKMGDSQYSTFEARKQGRKTIKKAKKKKNQQQSQDSKVVVAQTSSRRYLKQRMSKTTYNFAKKKTQTKKALSNKQNKISNQKENDQEIMKTDYNKFYVWNVPIKQEDYSLVALNKQIQKKNQQSEMKKPEKSFKQQAQQFLKQKQMIKFQEQRKKTRQQYLQQRVKEKKDQIMKQFQQIYKNN